MPVDGFRMHTLYHVTCSALLHQARSLHDRISTLLRSDKIEGMFQSKLYQPKQNALDALMTPHQQAPEGVELNTLARA